MRFSKVLAVLFLVLVNSAQGSGTRIINVDQFKSADTTKTWSLPASTDTLTGRASTDTLTNKSIAGDTNTLTKVPIASDSQQETPSGTVNGSNVTFTLAFTPVTSVSLRLYLDGVLLLQGGGEDYTLSGATITMITAPATAQALLAVYPKY